MIDWFWIYCDILQDLVCAGVDIPGHSAALPPDTEDNDQDLLEKERMHRLACALPEVDPQLIELNPSHTAIWVLSLLTYAHSLTQSQHYRKCFVSSHSDSLSLTKKISTSKSMLLLWPCDTKLISWKQMENLAAFVLDSCIFNLLSEVSHGEESISIWSSEVFWFISSCLSRRSCPPWHMGIPSRSGLDLPRQNWIQFKTMHSK